MIALMLDDLRRPSGISLPMLLPAAIKVLDFDALIAGRLADTRERQAALLRLIGRIFPDDHRIVHDHIQEAHVDDDDPLLHADHVRSHSDASVLVGAQGIQEILPDGQVLLCGRCGFLAEEEGVFYDWSVHFKLFPHTQPKSQATIFLCPTCMTNR